MLATLNLVGFALLFPVAPQGKGGGGGANQTPVRQLLASFSFDKLDTNKDGSITLDELTKEVFAWLDHDHNGSLDRNELVKLPAEKNAREIEREREQERKEKKEKGEAPASKPAKEDAKPADSGKAYLEELDANKDGKVTAAEFKLPEGWFKKVDIDGDGKISKDEFLGTSAEKAKKTLRDLATKSPEEAFAELDSNKDGKISREEWTLNGKLFERADENGDGFLSKDELARGIEAAKKMGGKPGQGGKKDAPGDGGEKKPGDAPPR